MLRVRVPSAPNKINFTSLAFAPQSLSLRKDLRAKGVKVKKLITLAFDAGKICSLHSQTTARVAGSKTSGAKSFRTFPYGKAKGLSEGTAGTKVRKVRRLQQMLRQASF
jgi:hypothetical protein